MQSDTNTILKGQHYCLDTVHCSRCLVIISLRLSYLSERVWLVVIRTQCAFSLKCATSIGPVTESIINDFFTWDGVQWSWASLTHWGQDKMAAIFQTMFSNAFSWMRILVFWLKFHWSLFPRVQLTIFQHWFRKWLGVGQATSHCLNQWWLVDWQI